MFPKNTSSWLTFLRRWWQQQLFNYRAARKRKAARVRARQLERHRAAFHDRSL